MSDDHAKAFEDDDWPKICALEMGQPVTIQFSADEEARPVVCPSCRTPIVFDLSLVLVIGRVAMELRNEGPSHSPILDRLKKGEMLCASCGAYDLARKHGNGN